MNLKNKFYLRQAAKKKWFKLKNQDELTPTEKLSVHIRRFKFIENQLYAYFKILFMEFLLMVKYLG